MSEQPKEHIHKPILDLIEILFPQNEEGCELSDQQCWYLAERGHVGHLQECDDCPLPSRMRNHGLYLRFRPHPEPATRAELIAQANAESLRKMIDEQRAEAARAASEDVLDNICHNCGGLADGAEQCNSCYVKSLRGERE